VEKPTAEPTPVTYGRPDYPTPHPVHPHGNDPALPRPAADYRGDDGADAENGSALSRWLGGRSKRRP
jgi:hypothetical protein